MATGNWNGAIAVFEESLLLASDLDALGNLGICLCLDKEMSRAIQVLTSAIARNDRLPELFFYRAVARKAEQQLDLAREDYAKVLQLAEEGSPIWQEASRGLDALTASGAP
jgi:tetratricopeptide (TPR) repeat protein